MIFAKQYKSFSSVLKKYFSFRNETASFVPLAEFLSSIRNEDFTIILSYLQESPNITENFSHYLHRLFANKSFILSFTEANILSENAFIAEFRKRLLNKILPPVEKEDTVWYIIENVSVRPKSDLKFLMNIHEKDLDEFFRMMHIDAFILKSQVKRELVYSMNILIRRVTGNAMEAEIVEMVPEYKNSDNPFIALQKEIETVDNALEQDKNFHLTSKDELFKQIKIYLTHCFEFVEHSFKNSYKYGISSKINQSLMKMRQQLQRISDISQLLVIDSKEDELIKSKQLVYNILEYRSHKNNLKELFDDSTLLISHLITNHTAETGRHYITATYKDYMKMFWKAVGGGVIVGALCVLKMLYGYLHGSEFFHAMMYAFNYAMGFVMIYLMNFTLATKQPAMTAATMAKAISDENNSKRNYTEFADLVSRLIRSQFIAFVGNVLLSFPVAMAIIYGLNVLLNTNMATGKADTLLRDLNPFESKAILHACITGFFLFLSGIIAGNIGNNSVYYKIPLRIYKNALIIRLFGKKIAFRISKYYARNWSGIVSNAWFGIFLGITGPIGKFLGVDLDIRHITFAAGNFALGLYGKDFSITTSLFIICFITIFVIGFFNFTVSFGLSMLLAFRSRKIHFEDVARIMQEIFRYFFRNPLKFFFPIRSYPGATTTTKKKAK